MERAAAGLLERYEPLAVIGAVVLAPAGLAGLAERFLQTDLPAVWRAPYLGYDYVCFYEASARLAAGRSPYDVLEYVTPPLPAVLNLPLTLLEFQTATLCVCGLIVGSLALAHGAVCRRFFEPEQEECQIVYWGGLLLMLFCTPVLSLVDRGNIDGFVLLLLCAGLTASRRQELAGGLLLGVGAGLKVYPLLLCVPLAIFGRRKALAGLLLGVLICVAATPGLWLEFLGQRLPRRLQFGGIGENASIANVFVALGSIVDPAPHTEGSPAGAEMPRRLDLWVNAAYGLYAVLLALKMRSDWRARARQDATEQLVRTLLYFPFLVAIPKVSFHYTLILVFPLIPALLALSQRGATPATRRPLRLAALGIGLSQFPAAAFESLAQTRLTHAIPALGLLAVMVSSVLPGWRRVP